LQNLHFVKQESEKEAQIVARDTWQIDLHASHDFPPGKVCMKKKSHVEVWQGTKNNILTRRVQPKS